MQCVSMSSAVRRVKEESRVRSLNVPHNGEVDEHGEYKPVPPRKPMSSVACHSPPPYRMPPYPLYGETAIPGAAASDTAISTAGLHTHSSKFPIEREVILSSADKNSKIPILNEYKKQHPKSIAPEGPNKQVAWTESKYQTPPDNHYMYNSQQQHHVGISTGAVPRTWAGGTLGRNSLASQSESTLLDAVKDIDKNKPFPTRTYHTIKDMISSRFGNGKVPKDTEGYGASNKVEQNAAPVLNNTPEANTPGSRKDNTQGKQNRNAIEYAQAVPAVSYLNVGKWEGGEGIMYHNAARRDAGEDLPEAALQKTGANENVPGTSSGQGRRETVDGMLHNGRRDMGGGGVGPAFHKGRRNEAEVPLHGNSKRDIGNMRREEGEENVQGENTLYNQQIAGRPLKHASQVESSSILQGRREVAEGMHHGFHAARRDQAGIYMVMRQVQKSGGSEYGSLNTVALAKKGETEEDIDVGQKTMRRKEENTTGQQQSSGQSSDYEKATQRSNADSGRGSTVYSSARQMAQASQHLDTSTESSDSPQSVGVFSGLAATNDSEWVDIVESELHQILDPKIHILGQSMPPTGANSTLSESISSVSPPLPPLSPGGGSSPSMSPQYSSRYKHSSRKGPQSATSNKLRTANSRGGWSGKNNLVPDKHHKQSSKKGDLGKMTLSPSVFGLDTTDLTSTTTGLDSVLGDNMENNSSDDDLSTAIDVMDAHAIRKQLEGLENMYSEVLKLLGVKKHSGRYQPSDPRVSKRRLYGSMSSLPSSVSSRPIRDKRHQDERKKVKDFKGINKRFQRLESHVVTLARSVAHLSSEMRTQHLMIQEMENIRGEISALRSQTMASRSHSMPRGLNMSLPEFPVLSNPARIKKLTKFFGDEPPLLRLFLRKLGYEKYAVTFEQERVGMLELPYLTEERLQKIGIPLGPRLRILQEAQISVCKDKVYVV